MSVQDARRSEAPATAQPRPKLLPHDSLRGRRVLIVEDDEILCRFLERMLRGEGLEVQVAHTGPAALNSLAADVALVILDLNLPELDGMAVLQALRARFACMPVLVLTARSRSESTVLALENGADDCLSKPFAYTELLARLRALIRRSGMAAADSVQPTSLALSPAEHRVARGSQRIDLTPREFALLEYLLRFPGIPVPRTELLREVWGEAPHSASNVVDVYMKYLRDKLDLPGLPKLIRTVRGVGYVCDAA